MSGSTKDYTVYLEDDNLSDFKNMLRSQGNFLENYGRYLGKLKKLKVDFSKFDVSKVTNMDDMFNSVKSFNQPIGDWNVSNVTSMSSMFYKAESFNQPIGDWNVSNVTEMTGMFGGALKFNQPIGNWNVSNVTNMQIMFNAAASFNQPIRSWNVSKVTTMSGMFYEASLFNKPIGNWNVSEVTNMWGMFKKAESFNQPIENWNVSKVTTMWNMFCKAKSFNQDISKWDVSKVKDIDEIGFDNPLKPKIAYSVYQWVLKNKITRNAAEKIFGSAAKLKEYEQEQNRQAIHGSLPSLRASPSVKTSLPRSIVYDVIELGEKPISAYKYSPKENNFPILFADKNDYKVIMSLDLEKILKDTNNIMYECKPSTPLDNLAIRRDQVKSTAYLQTSVLGIQIASVGVVELSSIQKTMKSLKERMEHNRKQTQKKLSALKSNKSARKKALLDTKIMPYIYKLKAVTGKKLGRLASETVLQQIGNYAVSGNHCQKMEPVQVYKLIKVKGKSASKKKSASKSRSAKHAKSI